MDKVERVGDEQALQSVASKQQAETQASSSNHTAPKTAQVSYQRFLSPASTFSNIYTVPQERGPTPGDSYDRPPSTVEYDVTESRIPVQKNIQIMEEVLFKVKLFSDKLPDNSLESEQAPILNPGADKTDFEETQGDPRNFSTEMLKEVPIETYSPSKARVGQRSLSHDSPWGVGLRQRATTQKEDSTSDPYTQPKQENSINPRLSLQARKNQLKNAMTSKGSFGSALSSKPTLVQKTQHSPNTQRSLRSSSKKWEEEHMPQEKTFPPVLKKSQSSPEKSVSSQDANRDGAAIGAHDKALSLTKSPTTSPNSNKRDKSSSKAVRSTEEAKSPQEKFPSRVLKKSQSSPQKRVTNQDTTQVQAATGIHEKPLSFSNSSTSSPNGNKMDKSSSKTAQAVEFVQTSRKKGTQASPPKAIASDSSPPKLKESVRRKQPVSSKKASTRHSEIEILTSDSEISQDNKRSRKVIKGKPKAQLSGLRDKDNDTQNSDSSASVVVVGVVKPEPGTNVPFYDKVVSLVSAHVKELEILSATPPLRSNSTAYKSFQREKRILSTTTKMKYNVMQEIRQLVSEEEALSTKSSLLAEKDSESAKLHSSETRIEESALQTHKLGQNLFVAAATGNLKEMELLLSQGADVHWEHKGKDNRTPLHEACGLGRVKHASLLIDRGANIQAKDYAGRTPLDIALRLGQVATVRLLLEKGADPKATKYEFEKRLIKHGKFQSKSHPVLREAEIDDSVAALLSSGKLVEGHKLCVAAKAGNLVVVQEMLQNDADANYRNAEGSTPLQEASFFGNIEVVACLLEAGADPLFRNAEGELPGQRFHSSVQRDTQTKIKALLEQESKGSGRAMLADVMSNSLKKVQARLDLGSDVNYTSPFSQNTPLHQACLSGSLEVVRLLLEHQANLNAKNQCGKTPLHQAARHSNPQISYTLIQHGAMLNEIDNDGRTPLYQAVETSSFDVTKLLIKQGARTDIRDNQNQTVFHVSAFLGVPLNVLMVLLEVFESEPPWCATEMIWDSEDNLQRTPLFLACMQGHRAHAQMLLEHGASCQIDPDASGKTPFQNGNLSQSVQESLLALLSQSTASMCVWGYTLISASRMGNLPKVQLMLKERETGPVDYSSPSQIANVDYRDAMGRTPVHQAVAYGHSDVVAFLVLEKRANFSIPDEEGMIPGMNFTAAVDQKQHSKILQILRKGASYNPSLYLGIEHLWSQEQILPTDENLDLKGNELVRSPSSSQKSLGFSRSVSGHKVLEWEELEVEGIIGEGSFGIVRKAQWRGMEVAVKELKLASQRFDDNYSEDLQHEGELLARVCNHSCVVQFVGLTVSPLAVITRYMKNGSVESLLVHSQKYYPQNLILRMSLEAAQGIKHLHAEGIIHRDLAARNLLIDEYMHVKVADFGFARVKETCLSRGYTSSDMGPIKWTAPEAMRRKEYSERSDIFSFGVVLYEMLVRHPPWEGVENLDVVYRVISGERMELPNQLDAELKRLMQACWEQEATSRMTISQVIEVLQRNLQHELMFSFQSNAEDNFPVPANLMHSYSEITVVDEFETIQDTVFNIASPAESHVHDDDSLFDNMDLNFPDK